MAVQIAPETPSRPQTPDGPSGRLAEGLFTKPSTALAHDGSTVRLPTDAGEIHHDCGMHLIGQLDAHHMARRGQNAKRHRRPAPSGIAVASRRGELLHESIVQKVGDNGGDRGRADIKPFAEIDTRNQPVGAHGFEHLLAQAACAGEAGSSRPAPQGDVLALVDSAIHIHLVQPKN